MEIKIDDLTGDAIAALLNEHLQDMYAHSPPCSVHALDLDRLRRPEITFWTVWDGSDLAGCGALKELDPQHGEIKSMRTAQRYRGRGVGSRLLQHIIDQSLARGYRRLSLETGSMAFFEPACKLYGRFGFESCAPFGTYVEDPNSLFMTRVLVADETPSGALGEMLTDAKIQYKK